MRLDKYVASLSDYSRSEVKRLLKQGAINVNQITISRPEHQVHIDTDDVQLFGEPLGKPGFRYFMLHKPQQTVCANTDSTHPTVIDLLNEPNAHLLQIAGRLDKDTTGLVLLTDDGQWNHNITKPAKQCYKIYQVGLAEPISHKMIEQLQQGIQLNGEKAPTLPAQVRVIDPQHIQLSIQEGKYHQVKRMLAAVGNHVEQLHRLQVGDIVLDNELSEGEYRPLTAAEINTVVCP